MNMYFPQLLLAAAFCGLFTVAATAQDPFGDSSAADDLFGDSAPADAPRIEVQPTPAGPRIEIENADRVEVQPVPGGLRIEAEKDVEPAPSYETEQIAIPPRFELFLEFPRRRIDALQTRLDHYGLIDNRHEWATLWVLCRGDEPLPVVDFSRELVLYYFNDYSGERLPATAFVTDGNLSVRESRMFRRDHAVMPTPGVMPMHIQVIPRAGLVRMHYPEKGRSLLIPGGFLEPPAVNAAEVLERSR